MYSNIAYEVFYIYQGLAVHQMFVEFLTQNVIFRALFYMLIAFTIWGVIVGFATKRVAFAFFPHSNITGASVLKIMFSIILGLSILHLNSSMTVLDHKGQSWSNNGYLKKELGQRIQNENQVSVLMDFVVTPIEAFSSMMTNWIEYYFSVGNQQNIKSDYFYRAVMAAGTATISDQSIVKKLDVFNQQCLQKVYAELQQKLAKNPDKLVSTIVDKFYRGELFVAKLQKIMVENKNCNQYNEELKNDLVSYVQSNDNLFWRRMRSPKVEDIDRKNLILSGMLANYYHESTGHGLIHEGAKLAGSGKYMQYLRKLLSLETLDIVTFGAFNLSGSGAASSLANQFSENLKRAPHLRGWIKMLLIGVFPFLIFFLLLGRWKYLVGWSLFYFSVCCWTPIWTLLHHINLKMLQSIETVNALKNVTNGFSVYSVTLILSKINYSYAVYALLQTSLGIGFTVMFFAFVTMPLLKDKTPDNAPGELTGGAKAAAKMVV